MTTSYTSLLGLALPVQGELTGTWGTTVNSYITQYLDAAVAGAQTISGTQTAVTLSVSNGVSLSQAASAATGSSQYAIINCTGNPAGLLTITAPAASKVYLVINATSTNQSVKVVGVGPTTGVTIAASRAALIAWNGTDFRLVATTDISQLSGILGVANGGTGLSSGTSGGVPYFSGSTTIASSNALAANALVVGGGAGAAPATVTTGTGVVTALGVNVGSAGAVVVNGGALGTPSSGTLTNATGLPLSTGVTGTLATTNGGTGLASFTANQVFYASSTSAVAQSTNLQFNGTTLTVANDALVNGLTVGRGAGAISTNTAVGASALSSNTSGSLNVAVGYQAGYLGNNIGNSSLGYQAARNNNGTYNVAIGYQSTYSSGTVVNNTGTYNVAIGYSSLYSLTGGNGNVAIGMSTLENNSSGGANTAVGQYALNQNTTAGSNVAVGQQSLYSNTTGTFNSALGTQALFSNTTQSNQTAVGYQAMLYMRGGDNTANGYQAMYGSSTPANNTGTGNIAYGYQSLYNLTSGSNNIALGRISGYYLTSGSNNVIIGGFSGSGAFMSGTDSNYIVLSDGAGNVRAYWNNNGVGVFNAAIQTAVGSVSSAATITPTANASNQYNVTALAVPATFAAPSGTPADGQKLLLRIKDNGTARALTWNATYRVIGTTLPTTTVASKTTYVGCVYNSADAVWDVVAVTTQA